MSRIKQTHTSVSRSNTKQELPVIALKTPRSGGFTQSKSYIGEFSKQFGENIEYDDMDGSKLNKQQRRLKDILRKMNSDTVKIISEYHPKPKKLHHHRTATMILAVNQQESMINQKIIQQCQIEICKLKERAQGLYSAGKSVYMESIGDLYEEVLAEQEQIRSLRNEIGKTGKSILTENRILEEGEIRKIETDVYLAEHKASHLRADDLRITQQIKQYENKLRDISMKWSEADRYLKEQQKKVKQLTNLKNNEQQMIHKKAILQSIRKKNEFYNQNNQYRYLNLLKQLEASNNSGKQLQNKIDKNFVSLEASKMIMAKLENQLRSMRQVKRVKEDQLNQFLNKTRNNGLRLGLENREMPSQIENHQEEGDISGTDLALAGLVDSNGESRVKVRENVIEEVIKQRKETTVKNEVKIKIQGENKSKILE